MGQKNSRIENSTFESEIVATKESLVNTFDESFSLSKITNNIPNNQQKNFPKKTSDKIISQVLKKNSSENFKNQLTHSRSKSSACRERNLNGSRLFEKKSLVNNFYVFLNKDNSFGKNMDQNKSVSYYVPEDCNENDNSKSEFNGLSKRSKSISEITDLTVSKIEVIQSDAFNDLEKKTIKITYKFIQDDLNSVGVIAFMKSFETLPDIQDKFEAFNFLPIDELSKSHALRTHSKKVMNIIDQYVNALENDQLDQMNQKLFHLGERHHIYRAKKDYFSIIEYQFITAIRPIITKNLRLIKKNQLIEINEDFSNTFDDRFLNSSEDDLYIDSYLNNDEVLRAFDFIKLMWHKVFVAIRFNMDLGMDSFESRLKT